MPWQTIELQGFNSDWNMRAPTSFALIVVFAGLYSTALADNIRKIIPAAGKQVEVSEAVMKEFPTRSKHRSSTVSFSRERTTRRLIVRTYSGTATSGT
jgi:hypothetical protein